jgi:hypothetical protein
MNRATMLEELQGVLNDATTSGVWNTITLLGYLAEGQDKFCEETGFFLYRTNYSITLEADVAIYDIPDRVIQIQNIWDGTRKLGKVLTGDTVTDDDSEWTFDTTQPGTPRLWQTDQETGTITLYPVPTADDATDVYVLQVWRYSQYDLAGDGTVEGTAAVPEIPSRFQRACIEWAAYKAFMHHDMEAQDPVKAADHLNAFKMYVDDGVTAMRRYHNIETRVGTNQAYRT